MWSEPLITADKMNSMAEGVPVDLMDGDEVQDRARKYRSRLQRPCDLCRTRKIQCKKQNDALACQKCSELSRVCTFVLQPVKKKARPVEDHSTIGPTQETIAEIQALMAGNDCYIASQSPFWRSLDNNQLFGCEYDRPVEAIDSTRAALDPSGFSLDTNNNHTSGSEIDQDESVEINHGMPNDPLTPVISSDRVMSRHAIRDATGYPNHSILQFSGPTDVPEASPHEPTCRTEFDDVFSLNLRSNYSSQWVGFSSESDPYLLQHYAYDSRDIYPMFRLDFRQILDNVDDRPTVPQNDSSSTNYNQASRCTPVHFMMTNEEILQDTFSFQERMLSSGNTQADDVDLLKETVPPELGDRLLKMYCQYVHPRFPVLANFDFKELQGCLGPASTSIGVQSAVYALATPYMFLDDELSLTTGYSGVSCDDLWAIAYRCYHRGKSSARLSLLQLCLLLLQRPPENFAVSDSPNLWDLSCSALAIAETLGLNMDPRRWKLPREEVKLRRRLWWLTYTQHIWHACAFGRSVHIDDNNWDVTHLTLEDFNLDLLDTHDSISRSKATQHISIFIAECRMAEILADVLKEF
ncbi:hypothetical protein N7456_002644 [Penicillium angulare]|uniref:Zn(2)-C6 fungal-type domain-containing protein n=1 Tax=Penicillium angulare TaxID=116970 RepID=A0A9W9G9M0_9EURO|nr:hypothetical protein N7456_002644 [Penicillium angulare]